MVCIYYSRQNHEVIRRSWLVLFLPKYFKSNHFIVWHNVPVHVYSWVTLCKYAQSEACLLFLSCPCLGEREREKCWNPKNENPLSLLLVLPTNPRDPSDPSDSPFLTANFAIHEFVVVAIHLITTLQSTVRRVSPFTFLNQVLFKILL